MKKTDKSEKTEKLTAKEQALWDKTFETALGKKKPEEAAYDADLLILDLREFNGSENADRLDRSKWIRNYRNENIHATYEEASKVWNAEHEKDTP